MTRKDIETLLFDPVQSPSVRNWEKLLGLFYVLNVPPFMQ